MPADLVLRVRARPPWPVRPYPLLLPTSHPELLAGRDHDLRELLDLLRRPAAILGLHAPSGAGKSSLLRAGLVESLRGAERPVASVRYPAEPGLARRILAELLEGGFDEDDSEPRRFADRLIDIGRLSGELPVLIVDQLEDVFDADGDLPEIASAKREARAVLGPLLAATAQRQRRCPTISRGPSASSRGPSPSSGLRRVALRTRGPRRGRSSSTPSSVLWRRGCAGSRDTRGVSPREQPNDWRRPSPTRESSSRTLRSGRSSRWSWRT